jgi:LysM repeat protein
MNFFRQLAAGFVMALASSAIVLGALSLASAEGISLYTLTPSSTSTPGLPQPGQITDTPQPTSTPTQDPYCPPPPGWVLYAVQVGDTLESLADQWNISPEQISAANCMMSDILISPSNLYLPALPTATNSPTPVVLPGVTEQPTSTPPRPTIRPCGPPAGWVPYTLQFGDTLYSLSRIFGISVSELQFANCISNPDDIKAGEVISVPFIPARSATATSTKPPAPSSTPKPPTQTSVPPTSTSVPPTNTSVPPTMTTAPTETPTETPTDTPTPTPTDTEQPTSTQTPTETPALPPP